MSRWQPSHERMTMFRFPRSVQEPEEGKRRLEGIGSRREGGGEWAIYECWESRGGGGGEKKERQGFRFDVGVFFDSYNSPAYRISSTQVVLKLCRRAAALSSPKLWQVDLLVLKFVQIRHHSWQTVKVSRLQCSCRGPFAFSLPFCRDTRFLTTNPAWNIIAVWARMWGAEFRSHLSHRIQTFLTSRGNKEWHKSRRSTFVRD